VPPSTTAPLVLLRCDAVPAGGVGHLVRCLAVAEAARAAGWRCLLVGEVTAPLAREMVECADVPVHPAGPGPLDALARRLGAAAVHVDSYEAFACPVGDPAELLVSAVQDGRFGRRDAHVVLDASATGDVTAAVLPSARVRLTGPRQALVREQVRVAARTRAGRTPAARVLVVAGGTDATGVVRRLAALVLAATDGLSAGGVPVEVLTLDPAAGEQPSREGRLVRRRPGADLVELAADALLVVTASGTTTSELAVLGVPMAVVAVVPNQAETHDRLVAAGAALGLGPADELTADGGAARALRALLADPDRLTALTTAAARQVDGSGADRLVAAWSAVAAGSSTAEQRGWEVARAASSDSDLLLSWRNDPETRRRSLDTAEVSPAEHGAWFRRVLADPDRDLLLVRCGGEPVGTVRFDREATGDREVSITLAPEQRGRGRAATVLACGEELMAAGPAAGGRVTARVKVDNAASGALFARAGYLRDEAASAADPGVDHWAKALAAGPAGTTVPGAAVPGAAVPDGTTVPGAADPGAAVSSRAGSPLGR
jgi:spore coat polysaccharide biosynthesis predicted glycosyltransferase SpsG/RimJ/RimL family protein N-acetyltransferase